MSNRLNTDSLWASPYELKESNSYLRFSHCTVAVPPNQPEGAGK